MQDKKAYGAKLRQCNREALITVAALALMGTPLLPGFVSKWMIGMAAVHSGTVMGTLGVAAILVSAVLTAIYLMSVAFFAFFRPLEDRPGLEPGVQCDPSWKMKLPLAVLSVAIVLCGVFSNAVVAHMTAIAASPAIILSLVSSTR